MGLTGLGLCVHMCACGFVCGGVCVGTCGARVCRGVPTCGALLVCKHLGESWPAPACEHCINVAAFICYFTA